MENNTEKVHKNVEEGVTKTTKKKRVSPVPFKYINLVGTNKSHYIRFAFREKTMTEVNEAIEKLYNDNIVDWSYCHVYEKKDNAGNTSFAAHGLLRATKPEYNWYFFKSRLPKACLRTSFYPEGTYNTNGTQITTLAEGEV